MKSTLSPPPPQPPLKTSANSRQKEDGRTLTRSERLEILTILRNASKRSSNLPKFSPSYLSHSEAPPPRLAIKIEERLSDLLWELMDDDRKASRFSEDYYIQREQFQRVLLDVVGTSDQYDKAIKYLHALLDTLNDPDAPLWSLGYPHPCEPLDFLQKLNRKLNEPNLSK